MEQTRKIPILKENVKQTLGTNRNSKSAHVLTNISFIRTFALLPVFL